jgi:hypothetical protein
MEGQFLMQKHFGATGPYDSLLLYGADAVGGIASGVEKLLQEAKDNG